MSLHWFDRLAMTAAGEEGVSRRGVFAGVAAGAFAASALSSPKLARAAAVMEVRAAGESCRGCVFDVVDDNNRRVMNCVKTGGKASGLLKKHKPKAPKTPSVPSAKVINCIIYVHLQSNGLLAGCRTSKCQNEGLPPIDTSGPSPGGPTTSGCAPGTTQCAGDLCCYGSDLCCGCAAAGGYICCASVVGCHCC